MDITQIERLVHLEEDIEDTLLGTVDIFGVPHHFQAIRVTLDAEGNQEPTRDPYWRFEKMQNLYDGCYKTVSIPGFEGEWAVCIYPFAD